MEIVLKEKIKEAVKNIYNSEVADDLIQIQETRKDFKGGFHTGCLSSAALFEKYTRENR